MLFILVSFGPKNLQVEHAEGPIEFGRGPQRQGVRRVTLDDQHASRDHLRAEELPGERIRLENLSQRLPITLDDGRQLAAGSALAVALPLRAALGRTEVTVAARLGASVALASADATAVRSLDGEEFLTIPLPVTAARPGAAPAGCSVSELRESPNADRLLPWMERVLALQCLLASPAELYQQTTQAMIELIGLDVGMILLRLGAYWKLVARSARLEDDAEVPSGCQFSLTVLDRVLAERRTFYQDVSALKCQGSLGKRNAVVASPIFGMEDEVVGALYGVRPGLAAGQEAKCPLDAQLMQLLAAAVSGSLARMTATRIECDLEIGRSIQTSFLPQALPLLPGWEVAVHFDPAREVSGDFYDVFALSDDHVALVIADVCNKGVGAALFMTLFRSLIRAFAQQSQGRGLFGAPGPRAADSATARRRTGLLADVIALSTVELTNHYVAGTHAEACMFASLFFGVLDVATGALTYVNGGHDAPVLMRAAGTAVRLTPTGPVVGVSLDAICDIGQAQLGPGDVLFAYTDGVTEARDRKGRFFTEKRLLSLLQGPPPSASTVLDTVVARLHEHVAGAEPFDDVTMLAVGRALVAILGKMEIVNCWK